MIRNKIREKCYRWEAQEMTGLFNSTNQKARAMLQSVKCSNTLWKINLIWLSPILVLEAIISNRHLCLSPTTKSKISPLQKSKCEKIILMTTWSTINGTKLLSMTWFKIGRKISQLTMASSWKEQKWQWQTELWAKIRNAQNLHLHHITTPIT